MTDDTKRKILRFLQRGDGAARRFGNRAANRVDLPPTIHDDGEVVKEAVDGFENMTSEELSRELRKQLIYSGAFIILLLVLVVGGVFLVLTGKIKRY